MVILVNFSSNALEAKYNDGSKSLIKTIPSNKIVVMKGLRVSEQLVNRDFLANHNVTIYDYERGIYYHNNGTSYVGLPFMFIGNNVKQSSLQDTSLGYSGTTTISGATFTKQEAEGPTTYNFILTADTAGTPGVITATTVNNNTYIAFKSPTTSLQLVNGLTANTTYTSLGITTTGGNGTGISASTFSLGANTTLPEANYYAYLQGLV